MPKLRDERILSVVFNQPWFIHDRVLTQIQTLVVAHALGNTIDADEVRSIVENRDDSVHDLTVEARRGRSNDDSQSGYTLHGSVARIPITGVLVEHSSMVNGVSQERGTGYDSIVAMIDEALADKRVSSILYHINSPGGHAQVCKMCADRMYEARSAKPSETMYESLGASAAVYLGSQSQRSHARPDSIVGSIGTYMVVTDYSRFFENAGVEVNVISSAPDKGSGVPGAPVSDTAKRQHQSIVDELAGQFVGAVARGRGVAESAIREQATGHVWMGQEALKRGLVDEIHEAVGSVIDAMNERYGSSTQQDNARADVVTGAPTQAAQSAKEIAMRGEQGTEAQTEAAGQDTNTTTTIDTDAIANAGKKAERDRVAAIKLRADRFMGTEGVRKLMDEAIDNETTPEQFSEQLMDLLAEEQPPTGHASGTHIEVGELGAQRETQASSLILAVRGNPSIEHALTAGGDRARRVARALGFDSPELADKAIRDAESAGLRGMSVSQMAHRSVARAEGISMDQSMRKYANAQDLLSAASHGSSDFPLLLANTANKTLQARFEEEDSWYERICRIRTATDYKLATIHRISEAADFQRLPEGQVPEQITFNERREGIQVEPWGVGFSFTFQMLANDDLQAFSDWAEAVALASARVPNISLVKLLEQNGGLGPVMSDGNTLFHADHNNLLDAAALSFNAAWAAIKSMRKQTGFGSDKAPLDIMPSLILTSVDLMDVAEDLYSQEKQDGQGKQQRRNTLRGRLKPVSTARLTSPNRWWTFAEPSRVPTFEARFYQGQRRPVISRVPSPTNMAQRFEAIMYGFGLSAINHEGATVNQGT